jgi:hypothetical protein
MQWLIIAIIGFDVSIGVAMTTNVVLKWNVESKRKVTYIRLIRSVFLFFK